MKLLYDGACFTTSQIGSRREPLRVYLVEEDGGPGRPKDWLLFCTGCFFGSEKQFTAAIMATYPTNLAAESVGHQYRKEYQAAIIAAREFLRLKAIEVAA